MQAHICAGLMLRLTTSITCAVARLFLKDKCTSAQTLSSKNSPVINISTNTQPQFWVWIGRWDAAVAHFKGLLENPPINPWHLIHQCHWTALKQIFQWQDSVPSYSVVNWQAFFLMDIVFSFKWTNRFKFVLCYMKQQLNHKNMAAREERE